MGSLLVVRFLMGIAHAPIYPIQAAVVERWFPVGHWALPNAVGSTGLALGAALAQPLVAVVMVYWGWRASFYLFIPLGIVLFWVWWRYATDDPAEHPAMGQTELAQIQADREQLTPNVGFGAWRQLIRNRDTLLLTCAYFAENCIFYLFFTWFFHYLVTELGFSILETGFLASCPGSAARHGICWRIPLRHPLCAPWASPWMPHTGDHRAHWCRRVPVYRTLCQLPLHRCDIAFALLCQHPAHRRSLLVGTNLYCRALHGARLRRHEHGGQSGGHGRRTAHALPRRSHRLGGCPLDRHHHGICRCNPLAIHSRRQAVCASEYLNSLYSTESLSGTGKISEASRPTAIGGLAKTKEANSISTVAPHQG